MSVMVTRANVDSLLDNGQLYAAMNNGRWYQMRRNGATQKWKRDTSRIRIPFKYGFRGTGALTETDFRSEGDSLHFAHYRHVTDVPENLRPR